MRAHYGCMCHLIGGLLLLICVTTTPSTALKCSGRQSSPGREITCYTSRNDVAQLEDAICRCTTIVHQGHDLRSLDASELKSLQDIGKEANPDLKVVMSISDKHKLLKHSAKTRHEVAVNLTKILKQVDGVELNITAGNKERLVSFIKDLKDEMSNNSLEKLIFLVLPTKPEDLAKQFELKELSKYVDVFTVTTHYLKDSEETYRTFHPSRLMGLFDMLNTDSLVDLITGLGAPKHKILISVPASAYKFTLKNAENNTPRSLTVEKQPRLLDRKKLCEALSRGEWTVERDEDLTAPYAFKNTTWIAFEDEISLKIKGKYVILRDLPGLGIRDVENDLKNDCGISVKQAIYQAFNEMKRKSRAVVLSSLENDLKNTEIAYPRHVRSSNFRIVRVVDTEGKIRAVRENTQTAFICTRQGYFVHPKSCNRFYRCVKFNQDLDEYSVFEFDCPAGLAFDERTEVCVWPGSVLKGGACPGSSEIEPVARTRFRCPSKPGFYVDPQNCRWFFACYDLGGSEMVPYEFRCPFGLVFDEQKFICEWPWKVPNCHSPEHNRYSSYTYGGSYVPQTYVSHQGVFGQTGFIQQTYPGQSNTYRQNSYTAQNYNVDTTNNAYTKQVYDRTGAFGSYIARNRQNYNSHSTIGVPAKYNKNNYNPIRIQQGYDGYSYTTGDASGTSVDCDEKKNDADAAGPVLQYGVPNYDPANIPGTGTGYENNYNANDNSETGINYNENNYNINDAVKPMAGYDKQAYNPVLVPNVEYHNYNPGGTTETEVNHDTKNYDTNSGEKLGIGHDGPTYHSTGSAKAKPAHNEQNHNTGDETSTDVNYDKKNNNEGHTTVRPTIIYGQPYDPINIPGGDTGYQHNYNTYDGTGAGINYAENVYNTKTPSKPENVGQTYLPAKGPQGGSGYEHDYNANDGIGSGINYDGNVYNTNTPSKPTIGNVGQTYLPAKAPQGGTGYEYNYNAFDGTGSGVNYDGNIYNTNTPSKPTIGNVGQTYLPAKGPQGDPGYEHDYNANDGTGSGVNYDGNVYNTNTPSKPTIGNVGQTYLPAKGPQGGPEYEHDYNANDGIGSGVNYDGNVYNTNTPSKPTIGNVGQTYLPAKSPQGGPEYEHDHNANDGTGSGVNYDGNVYNTNTPSKPTIGNVGQTYLPAKAPQGGTGYENNYNTDGANGAGIGYNLYNPYNPFISYESGFQGSVPFNPNNYEGQQGNIAGSIGTGPDCDGQVPNPQVIYNGQNFNPNGPGYIYGSNQGYPGITYNNPVYTNPGIVYAYNPSGNNDQNVNIGNKDHDKKSDDCDNQGDKSGGDKKINNDGVKTTPFNSGHSTTIVDANNYNTDTHVTTGLTDGTNNYVGGSGSTTGHTTGYPSEYSKNTGHPRGSTNSGHITTYSPSTAGVITHNDLSTNQFDKTDLFGGTNSVATVGNTQYPSTLGPILYNTSYSIGTGFPTTTIIPYSSKQDTFNPAGHQGTTPVNSVIYHSQLAHGLTSTDHFGNEYTNQAEKSFTTPGQLSTGVAPHGTTPYSPNYDILTNVYDYSKINLDNATSAVTIIGDGDPGHSQNVNGATDFGHQTTKTFNYPTSFTNEVNNSPYVGSSITSTNSDIAHFHESTKLPTNFGTNENTAGSTIPTIAPLSNVQPEIELDNSGLFGSKTGSSTTPASEVQAPLSTSTTEYTGYKTNEYYDNGGRGTIRYNNGVVATKVSENDIQDYRTSSYTKLPNSFIISAGHGENEQSTIYQANTGTNQQDTTGVFTKEGFTKTGPTKTGITTAQVGGSGSYVIGNGPTRVKPNPQLIGEHAFSVNFGDTGSTVNFETSPPTNSFTNNELLKFDTETPNDFGGYSYPKPKIEVEIKGTSSLAPNHQSKLFTTPSTDTQSFNNQNSVIIESNGHTNPDYSNTVAPVQYTSPLHKFRTTTSDISTQGISTHRPEVEAEFGTIVSSTPTPTTTYKSRYHANNLSTKPDGYLDVGVSFDKGNDYISTVQDSTGGTDYSDITANFDQGNFGQKIGQTVFTNYQHPTTHAKVTTQNSELIKSTQDGYDFYTQAIDDSITRAGFLHNNRPENLVSTQNLRSSTTAPLNSNRFIRPIVTAEFPQNQFDPAEYSQLKSSNKILANQASRNYEYSYHGPSNKILSNAASGNSGSQNLNNRFLNNQVSINSNSQVPSTRLLNNQNTNDFAFRSPANEIISNLAFENSYSGQNQAVNGHTRTLIGSNVVTSIGGTNFNEEFLPQENYKIFREFNSINNKNFGTTSAPEITTYTGNFGKNNITNAQNKNRNVVVKLSDLHPLILGKLSAECTCKADPFAIFRGSNRQTLPINSQNRGYVDLANYDESDIYVDVDTETVNEQDIELIKNIPSNRLIKPSKLINEGSKGIIVKSREQPSTTYLPPIRTSSLSSYLPPAGLSNAYTPSSTETAIAPVYRHNQASLAASTQNHESVLIRGEDNNFSDPALLTSRRRSGKSLFDESSRSYNKIKSQSDSNNLLKVGSFKTDDDSIPHDLECVRPGLFRHPKLCNKFYACHWDNWKKRYTLHVFNCPVHLAFDSSAGACNYPSKGPACQDNKLLV